MAMGTPFHPEDNTPFLHPATSAAHRVRAPAELAVRGQQVAARLLFDIQAI